MHAFDSGIREAEAGGSLNLRPDWSLILLQKEISKLRD